MSEEAIRELTRSIELLVISTDRLSTRIDRLLSGQSSGSDSLPAPVIEVSPGVPTAEIGQVIELSKNPFPAHFTEYCLQQRYRDFGEGPQLPDFALRFAQEKLSEKPPGSQKRARDAHWAGFWAKVAIDTCTTFHEKCLTPSGKISHWVVLRASRGAAFRTTTKRDLEALCDTKSETLVLGTFESLCEVEIFCLGAQAPIPPLKTC